MSRPALIQDLPVAEVDILGAEGGRQTIFANAMLAELLTRELEEDTEAQGAASAVEYDQLLELAAPAGDLLRVAHKLAAAVRLGEWCLERDAGTYDAALSRLLGSVLADVIALRQAGLRRRELVEAAEAGRRREVLTEAREIRDAGGRAARATWPPGSRRWRATGRRSRSRPDLAGRRPRGYPGRVHDERPNSGRPSWAAFSFRAPPCQALAPPVDTALIQISARWVPRAHHGLAVEVSPLQGRLARGGLFLALTNAAREATLMRKSMGRKST